jgi:hypothetical protein
LHKDYYPLKDAISPRSYTIADQMPSRDPLTCWNGDISYSGGVLAPIGSLIVSDDEAGMLDRITSP